MRSGCFRNLTQELPQKRPLREVSFLPFPSSPRSERMKTSAEIEVEQQRRCLSAPGEVPPPNSAQTSMA